MGFVIAVIVFLGVFVLLWMQSNKWQINRYLLISGWSVKFLFSVFFISTFSLSGIDGSTIQGDSYNFFYDSNVLNNYAYIDFGGYLKILLGFPVNEAELALSHLSTTNIWSFGDNGDLINDNRLIIRINSVIHFFSFGNIYVHVLVFSGFAFFGVILMYRTFESFVSNKKLLFISLAFFPSIAFWGSGLTKEALNIFAVGLFFYSFFKIIFQTPNVKTYLLLALSLFLLFFNKPYIGIVIVPISLLFVFGKLSNWNKIIIPIWIGAIFTSFIIFSFTPEKYNIVDKLSNRQRDMINLGKGGVFFITDSSFCAFDYNYFTHFDTLSQNKIKVNNQTKGEYKLFGPNPFYPFTIEPSDSTYELYLIQQPSNSFIDVTPIANSGKQLIKNIPEVFYNSLIRPLPGEANNNFSPVIFLLNLLLLFSIAIGIYLRKKTNNILNYLIWFLIVNSIILLLIIGWTTPVTGAVIRYKVIVDIFILIMIQLIIKPLKPKTA